MAENPFKLDWGAITPEFFDTNSNCAVHVINHDLSTKENIERNINFITARCLWYNHHLPPGTTQKVIIDARGQGITYERLKVIKTRILAAVKCELKVEFRQ